MNKTLAWLITLSSLTACASSLPTNNFLITRLRNRGPIPVSLDNPYLASNSLLDKEKERSAELRGFFEKRGAPSAIEVEKETFSPPHIIIYYRDKLEYYTLDEAGESWLIAGPYPVSTEKMRELNPLIQHMSKTGAPAAPAKAVEPPTVRVIPKEASTKEIAPPIPAPAPQPLAKLKAPQQPVEAAPVRPSSERAALEKLIATYGKNQAEISPRGDIVHYVVNEGESLRMIARWYTLDAVNAGRIASANKIDDPNKLLLGDSVIVPAALVKNKKILTEDAFGILKTIVEKR